MQMTLRKYVLDQLGSYANELSSYDHTAVYIYNMNLHGHVYRYVSITITLRIQPFTCIYVPFLRNVHAHVYTYTILEGGETRRVIQKSYLRIRQYVACGIGRQTSPILLCLISIPYSA